MWFRAPLSSAEARPHYSRNADNPQQIEKMRNFKLGLQEYFTIQPFQRFPHMPDGGNFYQKAERGMSSEPTESRLQA
jgi:hypothetical protein